jgi:predicted AAA+ superfamily ATPase
MNRHLRKFRFAMTGSSARKLKRGGANLLAGRAINRRFFPLTGAELNYDFDVDGLLETGCLPAVRVEESNTARIDTLEAYVANYLQEEIQQEAAVKRLDAFTSLIDTLIGFWLPAWQPRAKVKETRHPKFYFFDPGVVRGIGGRLREPLDEEERGRLLET